jgi:hypothetical protein
MFGRISNCAALVSSLDLSAAGIIRYVSIALWATLYLTYTSLFGVRLQSWDYNSPGHCYSTNRLSTRNADHPFVDHIYIAFTCLYVFVSLLLAAMKPNYLGFLLQTVEFAGSPSKQSLKELLLKQRSLKELILELRSPKGLFPHKESLEKLRNSVFIQYTVICVAFLQFPLHAYSIFTLRRSNESLLNNGNNEQAWGFSQVGAMILLAPNLIGIFFAVKSKC